MKLQLELVFTGDGRRFLNYWDYVLGNDVIVEIINGELFRTEGEECEKEKITVQGFVESVRQSKEREIEKYGV